MNISILQICLISLFYCFSNISWPFGSMGQWATINRPLVGGLVVGLILGNPVQGTIIGATINVIYLGLVSAGGSLPADSGMAGIMGTTFALIGGLDTNTALALAVPMGLVGAVIEVLTMTGQCMLIPLADKWIEQGKSKLVIWANTWIPYIVKSIIRFIIVFVILYFGSNALDSVTNALSGRVLDALSVMGGMLPAVGVGMMLLSIFKGNARWFLFLGFLATSFLGLNTIDDGSALIYIVGGHLADIVQKGQNLCLRQRDLLVFLNSELRLQLRLFRHALVEPFRQHFHGLPLLNGLPEILNGRVRLSDRLFQRLGSQVIRAFSALLSYLLGNEADFLLGQHFQTLVDHTVLDIRLADDLLAALFPAGVFAHIVVILPAGLAGAAVTHHHFLAVSAEQLCGQQVFALAVSSSRRIFVFVYHRLPPVK